MEETMQQSVIQWLSDFTSIPREKLTPQTTLLGDLGIDGDDGVELIEGYIKTFEVDPTGIQIDRHFGPEVMPWNAPLRLDWLYRRIFLGQCPEVFHSLIPIRIQDLIDISVSQKWTIKYL
jgi:acyl carrier protein